MTEEEMIDKMIEDTIFATEHLKEYKTEYYKQHRDSCNPDIRGRNNIIYRSRNPGIWDGVN
jgi:hypothetical protein